MNISNSLNKCFFLDSGTIYANDIDIRIWDKYTTQIIH